MTVMTGWDLFEDMRAAQDEMLRAAPGDTVGGPASNPAAPPATSAWAPAVDIIRT